MGASKKDFDKEYIFNLIMPTGLSAEAEEEPSAQTEVPPSEEYIEPADNGLSLLKERINQATAAPSVQLHPVQELVLVNLMEQLVVERLDEVFSKFNCCRCDKCRRDVAALALNTLAPHYVVAEPDQLPALIKSCDTKEISSALVKAILQVKNHPQH